MNQQINQYPFQKPIQSLNPQQHKLNQIRFGKSYFTSSASYNKNKQFNINMPTNNLIQNKLNSSLKINENNFQYKKSLRNNPAHNKIFLNITSQSQSIQNKYEFKHSQQYKQRIKQLQLRIEHLQKQSTINKTIFQQTKVTNQNIIMLLQNENGKLKSQNNSLTQTNQQLQNNIVTLKRQIEIEKSKTSQSSQPSYLNAGQQYRLLGRQFQQKINFLYEQNYKLKNTINHLQSKVQQYETKNHSQNLLIQTFQKRDLNKLQEVQQEKQSLKQKIAKLQKEIIYLKQKNDQLISEHQMEILKLENLVSQLRINQNKNGACRGQSYDIRRKNQRLQHEIEQLKFALKDQISQIMRLKQKNIKLTKMISMNR